jgi:hypothetical protein
MNGLGILATEAASTDYSDLEGSIAAESDITSETRLKTHVLKWHFSRRLSVHSLW